MSERGDRDLLAVPEEVLRLLEERARIEGWLVKLDELRAEATPEVYRKVRSDYEERSGGVHDRLVRHRSELEHSLRRHDERVAELQGRRDATAARLEETALRFGVGEYGNREWEHRRDEGGAEIAALDARLLDERQARASLNEVLGKLAGGRPSIPGSPKRPEEEGPPEGEEMFVKDWASGRRGWVGAPRAPQV